MTMPPKPNVRRARQQDLDQLMVLELLSFSGDRLSRDRFRHWLKADNGFLLVVESPADGSITAYVLAFTRRDSTLARIYSIAVSPQYKGHGIGRLLLARAEQEARQMGSRGLRLEVAQNNMPAIGLYESMGYQRFATLPGYYEDGQTAVRMQKRFE